MARSPVGGEVDQRRAAGGGEVASVHALGAQQRVDLGAGAAFGDRDVRRLRGRRPCGQDLERLVVGHPLLQVIGPGAEIAALAGQRRAHLEEESGRDHAGLGQLVAHLTRGGVGGHGHRHAPVRRAVEGLEQLDQEPDQRRRRGQQEQRDDPTDPRVLAVRARRPAARRGASAVRSGRAAIALSRGTRLLPIARGALVAVRHAARAPRRPHSHRLAG